MRWWMLAAPVVVLILQLFVTQTIMLRILNLYSDVCQSFLKLENKRHIFTITDKDRVKW